MNQKLTSSVGIVALMGLLLHFAPSGTSSPKEQAKAAASPPSSSNPSNEKHAGPWLATCKYFGRQPASGTSPDFCASPKLAIDYAIASVPDPVRTRLGYFADRSIEGMQRAAQQLGWDFDSQWLPWKRGTNADAEKAWVDRTDEDAEPGIMLFRNTDRTRLLLIFVIGETPTAGIDIAAFRKALTYGVELTAGKQAVTGIAGPTFSGSLSSLRAAIDSVAKPPAFAVFSGTLTSAESVRVFERPGIVFHGGTHNSIATRHRLVEVADMLGIADRDQIAILLEDETAFARAYTGHPDGIREIRFPREISSLRNAYQDGTGASGQPVLPLSGHLPLSLHDSDGGEDSVPVLARTYTPQSQYAALASIVEALRGRTKLVEIASTSVLDALFLAGMIRDGSPDTRILIPNTDLLFIRAAREQSLSGVLSLASYPLYLRNQQWTLTAKAAARNPALVPFPDSNEEGVFNATLLLLQSQYHAPLEAAPLEYGDPFQRTAQPPQWLMEATAWGYWPVTVFHNTSDDSKWLAPSSGKMATAFQMPPPPKQWWLLNALVICLSLAMAVFSLRACLTGTRHFDLFAIVPGQARPLRRLLLKLGAIACCWGLLAAVDAPLLGPWPQTDNAGPALIGLASAVVAFLLLAAWVASVCFAGIGTWAQFRMFLLPPLFAGACVFAAHLIRWSQSPEEQALMALRALQITSGCSPAVPVILLLSGLLLACLVHLRRISLAWERNPGIPVEGLDESSGPGLLRFWMRSDLMLKNSTGLGHGWVFVATLAVTLFCFGRSCLMTPNREGYTLVFMGLAILLLVGLVFSVIMFVRVWHILHSFLTELDRIPMAGAFRRIPREFSAAPVWQHVPAKRTYGTFFRSVRCFADLKNFGTEEWWNPDYANSLEGLLEAEAEIRLREIDRTRENYPAIARAAQSSANLLLRDILVPAWAKGREDPDPGDDYTFEPPSGSLTEKGYLKAAEFVALRYATYIRYMMMQLRNLIWFISGGFALLAIALNSLDFQSPHVIRWFTVALFAAILVPVASCLMDMERNAVLSRLANTKVGALNRDFYVKFASYGLLPLLSVLSTQFPSFSRFLFSWLQPTLESLK